MLVGYFTSWSVYRRAYYPGDIENSGAAERLDVINYAFAGIDENFQCEILDSFADYGKAWNKGSAGSGSTRMRTLRRSASGATASMPR